MLTVTLKPDLFSWKKSSCNKTKMKKYKQTNNNKTKLQRKNIKMFFFSGSRSLKKRFSVFRIISCD